MNAFSISTYVQSLEAKVRDMTSQIESLENRQVNASRFYSAKMSVAEVASLHGVHPDTVRKYISRGLINKHPDSTDGKIFIRASDALVLDFTSLKKESILNY